MLLLRVIRGRSRWSGRSAESPDDVAEAARADLTLRESEGGLSVFEVADPLAAESVALLFALTARERPDHLDYILFADECLGRLGLQAKSVADEALHPTLSECHREVYGLTAEVALRLAAEIMTDPQLLTARLRQGDIIERGRRLKETDPSLHAYLSTRWSIELT